MTNIELPNDLRKGEMLHCAQFNIMFQLIMCIN